MGGAKTKKIDGFGVLDLIMIGFGSIIGAGLFVASGLAVRSAGPSVVIGFLIGGIALAGVLNGLAEMASADPGPGGLRRYAARNLGPYMGFTIGWMYWSSGVVTMASEATAASLMARLWLPQVPLWVFSLVFSVLVTAVNFLDLRGYGKIETALSLMKILSLVAFAVVGLYFIARGSNAGIQAVRSHPPGVSALFPNGARGLAASMLMIMFSYAGVQSVGMASADARNPGRVVPRALTIVTISVVGLYLVIFTVLLVIFPWNQLTPGSSPFVQALQLLGLGWADKALTLVVMLAALSSMNTQLYGVSRMLYSLAKEGEAPRSFAREIKTGVPGAALGISGLVLAVGVVLAYWLPQSVYVLVTGAGGFISMFNWMVIGMSHLRFRPRFLRQNPSGLIYRSWGFPYLSMFTVAIAAGVLVTTPLAPGQLPGLVFGVTEFVLISIAYVVVMKPRLKGRARVQQRAQRFQPPGQPRDVRRRIR